MWTSKLLKLTVAACFVGHSTVFAQDLEDTQTPLPSGDEPVSAAPAPAAPAHDPTMDDNYGPNADMGEAVDDAMSEEEMRKTQTPEPEVAKEMVSQNDREPESVAKNEHKKKKAPAKKKAVAKKEVKKKKHATAKKEAKKPAKNKTAAKAKAKQPSRSVASVKKKPAKKAPAKKAPAKKKKKPSHDE